MDFLPIIVSVKTALAATAVTFVLGMAAAYLVVKMKYGKAVLDTILTLPMILPPTVIGFFLLLLFGKNSPVGMWLGSHGIQVVFSWAGTVVASTIAAFPMMYRTSRSAFEQMDRNLIYAGRTLGMSEWMIFWKIVFPNCIPGIAGGTILAFARALGEFGATIMLAGNIPGKTQTAAIAIYAAMQLGKREQAYQWAAVIVLISFVSILAMNYVNEKQTQFMKKRRG